MIERDEIRPFARGDESPVCVYETRLRGFAGSNTASLWSAKNITRVIFFARPFFGIEKGG
jgi:hypothetical protein